MNSENENVANLNSSGFSTCFSRVPNSTPSKIPMRTPKKAAAPASATAKVTEATPSRPTSAPSAMTPSSSREAAIQAKLQSTAERVKKVAILKEKWSKEKEQKMQKHKLKRDADMKRRQDQMEAAAEHRRIVLEKQREVEEKKKQEERESLKCSLDAAAQLSKDLVEKMKQRRRQSIALNNEILHRVEEKVQELAVQKKAEQDSWSESKRDDFLAVRQAKQNEAAKRRESMAMRTEVARQIKETEKDIAEQAKEVEKSILDMRHSSWADEKEYRKMEASKRRESLACRLDVWREHKKMDVHQKEEDLAQMVEEMDLRRDDWHARNAQKEEDAKKARESVAARLEKWRQETDQLKLTRAEESEARAYDFELKSREYEDVTNYKKQLEEERRESLAYRLASAREDKNWERGQIALLAIAAEESRQLEAEDRACVAAYKNKQEDDRRASIQYRNEVALQESIRQEGLRQQELEETIEDYNIKHDDWVDMQNYQQEQRDERRKSLAMRLVIARKHKEAALNSHKLNLQVMHEEFQLKQAACNDVREYQEEERKKRRDSVAVRLESWRQQRMQSEMEMLREMVQAEEDARIREQEAEDIRTAKEAMASKEKMDLLLGKMAF